VAADSLATRLERLRSSSAYRNYLRVREHVLEMKRIEAAESAETDSPSAYWREELENVEYLLDASPLVVERLRHHCYPITGIWPYSYRSGKSRDAYDLKLQALLGVGRPELFVPEPVALGGFGFETEGGFFNVDTLKYFEVLIALDRGAVLQPFLRPGDRRVVWEIGSGWGGFAYQFMSLAKNTTYVLVDLPELFLFSGTYLLSAFPDARAWFYGQDGSKAVDPDWNEVDFVFIPNTALDVFRPPRLDLTINMISFQEMTSEQVGAYVSHAAQLGTPFLYSLNRDRSLYNNQLSSVRQIVEQHYWPHEIDVLPVPYTSLPTDPSAYTAEGARRRRAKSGGEDSEYRHVVGWKRLGA
jgi:hypothetical protein